MAKIETTVVFNTDDAQNETMYTIRDICYDFPFKGQIIRYDWNGKDWVYLGRYCIRVTEGDALYQYNVGDKLTPNEYNKMKIRVKRAIKNWEEIQRTEKEKFKSETETTKNFEKMTEKITTIERVI